MSKIMCKVQECAYNSNESCDASQIQVRSCGCQNVKHSDETACDTFCKRSDCHC